MSAAMDEAADGPISASGKVLLSDVECPLCNEIYLHPVVTPCGHTFCRGCLVRAMDHNNACPLCRATVHMTADHAPCVLLDQLVRTLFEDAVRQREADAKADADDRHTLPIFILGGGDLLPGNPLPLHVFEPRYRLLIRRCLAGSRRFGILGKCNGRLATVGCIAQIERHVLLPDGRSFVQTKGCQRFNVLDSWTKDGYLMASIRCREEAPDLELDEGQRTRIRALQTKIVAHLGDASLRVAFLELDTWEDRITELEELTLNPKEQLCTDATCITM